jgi:L-threonylcarbamoyladenylate synthase
VYGLGANALDAAAVRKVYQAKQRPASSPLIVHVADLGMARRLVVSWPALADTLARHFWPGPLTIVLPKRTSVPDEVTAGLPSVGLRMPAHPVAAELIRRAEVPLAAPSANRFMAISPTSAEHVRDGLGELAELVLDAGPCSIGIESTVVSLAGEEPLILRPGHISKSDLEGATQLRWNFADPLAHAKESPGLHPRHYAPKTPFVLLKSSEVLPSGRGKILKLPADPLAYARELYAAMHQADKEGWDWIGTEEPPGTPEWAAVRDRLKRAAKPI